MSAQRELVLAVSESVTTNAGTIEYDTVRLTSVVLTYGQESLNVSYAIGVDVSGVFGIGRSGGHSLTGSDFVTAVSGQTDEQIQDNVLGDLITTAAVGSGTIQNVA